jgi:hypothetical protein
MTVEEFALELQRIKHKALFIDTSPTGREAAKRTRSYMNQKRGQAILTLHHRGLLRTL